MRYQVQLTDKAGRDLESIRDYIAESDSPANADRVLDVVLDVVMMLEQFPERGAHPRELLALGHEEYRQIVHRPWRIFYRIVGSHAYIALIADGRRDMRTLLAQRLLGA
ncbi:MAG: type II toxin-antitoxin system RelE/ParE family toxin [Rhodanobacteraceae bacterium]|nr:MAG: type II toxin-antitoxin system RelE/ParE family toxin [Rhodanobacteraceae bacterium]